jgi:PAS domain S-box-containing protein
LFDAFPEARGSIFEEKYTEAVNKKIPLVFETFFGVQPYENWYDVRVYPFDNGITVYFQVTTDRKRAEEALAAERELLAVTLRSIGDGVISTDVTGRVVSLNGKAEELTGWTENEAVGRPLDEVFHIINELTRERCENPVEKVLRTGGVVTLANNTVLIAKDGVERILTDSGAPIRDADGKVRGVVLVFQDVTGQRRALRALEESEARHRFAMDASNDGIWDWNVMTGEVYRSPGFFSMLSYNEKYFKGVFREWETLVHPDDLAAVRNRLDDYLSGKIATYEVEFRIKAGTGEMVWLLSRGKIVAEDEAGKPLRMVGTHTDITDRKRAEEALKESEARIRKKLEAILEPTGDVGALELGDVIDTEAIQALMDHFYGLTGIGVAILDKKGRVLVATGWQEICTKFHRVHPRTCLNCIESDTLLSAGPEEGAFKLYRCKNNMWDIATPIMVGGEHLGNLFLGQFIFQDEATDHETFRSQAREYGFDEEQYLAALAKVPRWRRQTVDAIMTFYTTLARLLARLSYSNIKLARSLDEKQRLLNSLRESEQRYKLLLDSVTDYIYTVQFQDNRPVATVHGPGCAAVTGYTPEDYAADPLLWYHMVYGPDREAVTRQAADIVAGKAPAPIEHRIYHRDGSVRWIRNTPVQRFDDGGTLVAFDGLIKDITDHKRAEEDKALLQQQLVRAQKMESVATLAGGIAHDFNNLLQVVLGYSDMLLLDMDAANPEYEGLQAIRRAGRDGADLAKRILAFSRRVEPQVRPINLNNEIARVEKMLRRMIPKMIQIETALADDLMTVNADPGQMEQILLNLAVNGQHAMPDGGRLIIKTENVTLDEEYCRNWPDTAPGKYVAMAVSDTGRGMAPEVLEHIFEPFFTTKGPGEGTGLGLAMVYGIVKSHNGHISCHSQTTLGTTFRIYFPAVLQGVGQDLSSTRQMSPLGSETILLVDDERTIRSLGEQLLARAGYKVLTAGNGLEALEVYRCGREEIALVILDLMMPEMGGRQCLEELLKINPKLKVVIASGYSADGHTKDFIDAGAKGFVCKPYEAREILAAVRKALDEG